MKFNDALKIAAAFGITAVVMLLVYVISDIFITFLAAIIFAIALDKPIDKLVKKKIPRGLAAIIIYFVFLGALVLMLFLVLPPLAQEIRSFAVNFPLYLENLLNPQSEGAITSSESLELGQYLRALADFVGTSSQTISGTVFKIFGGFISFFVIFFVALFFNIQKNGVRHFLFILIPKKHLRYANNFFDKIQDRVTGWIWGKTLSSLLVGAIIYFCLLFLDIPYAIVLAVIAVSLNFIPFVGPMISVLPAVLLALTLSIPHAIAVAIIFFLANSIIESFIFMPLFMKRAVNMNPALLILFVLIGGRIAGILGIIISIPVAAIVSLVVEEYLGNKLKVDFDEK